MKIVVKRQIEVPDKLICMNGKSRCSALTRPHEGDGNVNVCSHFNCFVWMSERAGFYVRCAACIESQRKYLEGIE